MARDDGTTGQLVARVDDLERRLTLLTDALARLSDEVRTRRLSVVDARGVARVVAEVTRGTAELRVVHEPHGIGAEVVLYAGAPDLEEATPACGVQLRAGGDALAEIDAAPDASGRWRVTSDQ